MGMLHCPVGGAVAGMTLVGARQAGKGIRCCWTRAVGLSQVIRGTWARGSASFRMEDSSAHLNRCCATSHHN